MPQLHLYVPRDIAREVKRRANAEHLTVSRYLAELVKREVVDDWPADFFSGVAGGWSGPPLERARQLPAESRPALDADAVERADRVAPEG